MNVWDYIDLFAFLGGLIFALLLTPLFSNLANKINFMDCPQGNHKGHKKATPLLGGAAMFSAWIICILLGFLLFYCLKLPFLVDIIDSNLEKLNATNMGVLIIIICATASVVLGLVDDKFAIGAAQKFGGQFVIALITATFGNVRINFFIDNEVITVAITVLWIMTLMNSINFFDNMDGLAVGITAIAMFFFCIISSLNNQYLIALASALSCGISVGFWFYNYNPATIFMGDSGSHFLGYLLAIISAKVTYFSDGEIQSILSIMSPFFILALPLFDTAMVFFIRTKNKKPFWIGDHNHISHRFVRMGLSRKQAVLVIHILAITLGLGALPLLWGDLRTAAILVAQMFFILLVITVIQFGTPEKNDTREREEK